MYIVIGEDKKTMRKKDWMKCSTLTECLQKIKNLRGKYSDIRFIWRVRREATES